MLLNTSDLYLTHIPDFMICTGVHALENTVCAFAFLLITKLDGCQCHQHKGKSIKFS